MREEKEYLIEGRIAVSTVKSRWFLLVLLPTRFIRSCIYREINHQSVSQPVSMLLHTTGQLCIFGQYTISRIEALSFEMINCFSL